jgi:hypothetical protein
VSRGRQAGIYLALDLHPQRPPGPPSAGAGVGVQDTGYRTGRGLGRGDDRRVDSVGEPVHDIDGDVIADVADYRGDSQASRGVTPGWPDATAISPASAAAEDSASSQECRASAISVAESMRLPTMSL